MMAHSLSTALFGLLLTSLLVDAFYLPGLAPTNFCTKTRQKSLSESNQQKCKVSLKARGGRVSRGKKSLFVILLTDSPSQSEVFVHVNKLDSVETIVPYEYSR